MVAGGFAWVRVLHLLSVGLALGALAALPAIRSRIHGAGDSKFALYGLSIMASIERWVLAPATAGVVLFGGAMVEGPLAEFDFTGETSGWLHWGATLWTTLALGVAALFHLRGRITERAELGATGGDRVDELWRWWMAAWLVALASVVFGSFVMAWRIGA